MDPLVSIIVPVYNVKPYLNRCVDSLLGQSYQNMELLLVDDGSTDGSETLCDEYAAQDARVRVLHKKNGGLSDARNAGVDAAAGEYLSFVDGDDWVSPYYIENLYRALEQAQSRVGYTAAKGRSRYFITFFAPSPLPTVEWLCAIRLGTPARFAPQRESTLRVFMWE